LQQWNTRNLERDAIELYKNCVGPEMFVEKRPPKEEKMFS